MTIVTVMLTFMLGIQYRITGAAIERESENVLRTMDMGPRRPGMPDEREDGDREYRMPFFTVRSDKNGEITDTFGDYYDFSDEEMIGELFRRALSAEEETGLFEENSLRYFRHETPFGTDITFADISGEAAAMKTMLKTSLKIGAAAFTGFLIINILLARWAVRPVEEAFIRQKQFISDASHELKTPLTVILTNTEMLNAPEYSREQKTVFAKNIGTMALQMRGLVEGLLSLTRVDNGRESLTIKDVDIAALAEETVLPFEPVFFEKGLSLKTSLVKDVTVRGDSEKLRQVIEILLDNAQKYSLPETETELALTRTRHAALLSVSSAGEEMTKQQLTDIFKRFYRGDTARSMNHSYGLGLSIAESIVEAHGGKIWAESAYGRNIFYVSLPLR